MLAELARSREALLEQYESAGLLLQNLALDMLKVRSSGLDSALDGITSARRRRGRCRARSATCSTPPTSCEISTKRATARRSVVGLTQRRQMCDRRREIPRMATGSIRENDHSDAAVGIFDDPVGEPASLAVVP